MQPIETDDYQSITKVNSPAVAADGTVAVVRVTPTGDDTYSTTILVGGSDDEEFRPFTAEEWNVGSPVWSPSGDRLAFISSRGTDRPQLWVAPVDGGEARRVTDVCGGVGSITWSPDGSAVAFVQEPKPDEIEADQDLERTEEYEEPTADPRVIRELVYRLESGSRPARTWEHYYDGARPHIYYVDLETDDVTRVTSVDSDHTAPAWGDADSLYFLGRYHGDDAPEYDILAYDRRQDTVSTVGDTVIQANTVPDLAATSDGRLAIPYDDPDAGLMPQTDIRILETETGEDRIVTAELDRKPSHSGVMSWDATEQYVYFKTDDEGANTIRRVRGDGSVPPEPVFVGHAINGAAIGDTHIAVTQSHWDHPGDLYVAKLPVDDELPIDGTQSEPADTEGAVARRRTDHNREYLADRAVMEPEEFWYPNGEGDEIQGWILTPPGFDPSETYPMVVQVHGGPSPVMWTTSGTMWHEWQLLAHQGYVVFWANPRGSTGYGGDFMRAVRRDYGGPFYRDTMAGVDYLLEEHDSLDPDNMSLTGGSYGGYMSAWAIGQTDRFEAAVAQRGVYDLRTMYGTTSFPHLTDWYYGVKPWEEPDTFVDHSPVAHAHNVDTPLLIIQSEHDYNCPRADAEMLYRYLYKNDVDTELVMYPREGHDLSRSGEPAHVIDRLDRIVNWFNGYSDHHEGPDQ